MICWRLVVDRAPLVRQRVNRMSEERRFPEHYLIEFPAVSRTRLLIPHLILFPLFAFSPSGAVDKIVLPEGMQSVDFQFCEGLTGTAGSRMSEVRIYLISFGGQPQHVLHSSFSFSFFFSPTSSLMLFLAGDLTQWHLPAGMKDLNLGLTKVTGKTPSE